MTPASDLLVDQSADTPGDWSVRSLSEVADVTMGQSPPSSAYNTHSVGLPLIQGNADIKNRRTIVRSWTSRWSKSCIAGDIVMTVRAPVGAVAIASADICLGRGVCGFSPKIDSGFLYHALVARELDWVRLAQGSTFTAANGEQVRGFTIAVPDSETEQRKIAEILSDTDSLITELERLITKKQNVMRGTMQTLLSGSRRLPGFSDPWRRVRLGDLLDYEQPTKYLVWTPIEESGEIPVLTAGKSFLLGYTNEAEGRYESPPVILFDDFTTASQWIDFTFKVKSSACKMLTRKDDLDSLRYLYERLQLINFRPSDHKRHWISTFSSFELEVPLSDEQHAIAGVLSDMDAEIEALEKRLAKTRDLKQGMAQELLSGRTRLV